MAGAICQHRAHAAIAWVHAHRTVSGRELMACAWHGMRRGWFKGTTDSILLLRLSRIAGM